MESLGLREEAGLVFSMDLTGEDPGRSFHCGKCTFCFWIQIVDTWKSTKPLTSSFFFWFSWILLQTFTSISKPK